MTEFSSQRVVTAKKQHVCDNCGHPINIGESYTYYVSKSDGIFWQAHSHNDCAKAWADYATEYGDFDGVGFLIDECLGDPEETVYFFKESHPTVFIKLVKTLRNRGANIEF